METFKQLAMGVAGLDAEKYAGRLDYRIMEPNLDQILFGS